MLILAITTIAKYTIKSEILVGIKSDSWIPNCVLNLTVWYRITVPAIIGYILA